MKPIPTSAVPGSAEKIEVLKQRANWGLPLFMPNDRIDCRGIKRLDVTKRERRAAMSERQAVHLFTSKKLLDE